MKGDERGLRRGNVGKTGEEEGRAALKGDERGLRGREKGEGEKEK